MYLGVRSRNSVPFFLKQFYVLHDLHLKEHIGYTNRLLIKADPVLVWDPFSVPGRFCQNFTCFRFQRCPSQDCLQHPAPYNLSREPCDLFLGLVSSEGDAQSTTNKSLKQVTGLSQKNVLGWVLQTVLAGASLFGS